MVEGDAIRLNSGWTMGAPQPGFFRAGWFRFRMRSATPPTEVRVHGGQRPDRPHSPCTPRVRSNWPPSVIALS